MDAYQEIFDELLAATSSAETRQIIDNLQRKYANVIYMALRINYDKELIRTYPFTGNCDRPGNAYRYGLIPLWIAIDLIETNQHVDRHHELLVLGEYGTAMNYPDTMRLVLAMNRLVITGLYHERDRSVVTSMTFLLQYLYQQAPYTFAKTLALVDLPILLKIASPSSKETLESLAKAINLKTETKPRAAVATRRRPPRSFRLRSGRAA